MGCDMIPNMAAEVQPILAFPNGKAPSERRHPGLAFEIAAMLAIKANLPTTYRGHDGRMIEISVETATALLSPDYLTTRLQDIARDEESHNAALELLAERKEHLIDAGRTLWGEEEFPPAEVAGPADTTEAGAELTPEDFLRGFTILAAALNGAAGQSDLLEAMLNQVAAPEVYLVDDTPWDAGLSSALAGAVQGFATFVNEVRGSQTPGAGTPPPSTT